jgi:hypothetical protein
METKPRVTVFVHGTYHLGCIVPSFLGPLSRFAVHKEGLFHTSAMNQEFCYAQFLSTLTHENPIQFPYEHAYLFVWDGRLKIQARKDAAVALHTALLALKKQYPEWELTVIAHSHGGNVALHLAELSNGSLYTIDRLILIATPVQNATKDLIKRPLFKEIIALYSRTDLFQIGDPQGLQYFFSTLFSAPKNNSQERIPLFSKRTFSNPRVKHVQILSNGRPISHIGFLFKSFLRALTPLLKIVESHNFTQRELLFDISPLPQN